MGLHSAQACLTLFQTYAIEDQLRVIEALDQLLQDAAGLDIKPLKGRPESRLRVGKYRVLFVVDQENEVYVVTTIGSRGDVYKS